MKAVIQRVESANVVVNEKEVSKIDKGLIVFLGINYKDEKIKANQLAKKICNLRIFRDENEKMNKSVVDIGGEILIVSNFSIYADATRGNRPNFQNAMQSDLAREIYDEFVSCVSLLVPTKTGIFHEHMKINQVCDGPINIIVEI